MLTSETHVYWVVEGPRVAGSHHNGDWFPLVKCGSKAEADEYVLGLARKYRAEGRTTGGWRVVELETHSTYLATYMDVEAVLGPLPTNEEEGKDSEG
jgi:hypothetical protein